MSSPPALEVGDLVELGRDTGRVAKLRIYTRDSSKGAKLVQEASVSWDSGKMTWELVSRLKPLRRA